MRMLKKFFNWYFEQYSKFYEMTNGYYNPML